MNEIPWVSTELAQEDLFQHETKLSVKNLIFSANMHGYTLLIIVEAFYF